GYSAHTRSTRRPAPAAGAGTKHHHRAAGVLLGGGHLAGGLGAQTRPDPLPPQPGRREAIERGEGPPPPRARGARPRGPARAAARRARRGRSMWRARAAPPPRGAALT